MASLIFLGGLYGVQWNMKDDWKWELTPGLWRGTGGKAIIAKGNIIEGIEAKE